VVVRVTNPSAALLNRNMEAKRCLNIAHRGGAALWPENTLSAFRGAAALCDGAELDVQLSADGHVVVFHDVAPNARNCRGLGPAPAGDKPLTAWTLAEVRALNVGSDAARETVPLLSEVIAAVRVVNPGFRLFAELKLYQTGAGAAESLAEATLAVLRREDFFDKAVLIGFDWGALLHAKHLEPALACWFSTPPSDASAGHEHEFRGALTHAIATAGGNGWFAHLSHAGAHNVEHAHAEGLHFGVWTVNEERDLAACLALGVDAICTDDPERLAALMG
jgi:glycerophosphoryl diester phosphodiesterase